MKKKTPQIHPIISKLQLKTYIIQGNSSREWLILNQPHTHTKTQTLKIMKQVLPPSPPCSFILGFHLRPAASEKMRKAKPQRVTAPKPNFGQDKEDAVNNIWGSFGKGLRTQGHFLLRWEISEAQISFLESA